MSPSRHRSAPLIRPTDLKRDKDGAITTEFALTFPILLIVLFWFVEMQHVVGDKRRLARICETVADVAVQQAALGSSERSDLANIARALSTGMDAAFLDIWIASIGAQTWNHRLLRSSSFDDQQGGGSGDVSFSDNESLIQTTCRYKVQPTLPAAMVGGDSFVVSHISAPRVAEHISLELGDDD